MITPEFATQNAGFLGLADQFAALHRTIATNAELAARGSPAAPLAQAGARADAGGAGGGGGGASTSNRPAQIALSAEAAGAAEAATRPGAQGPDAAAAAQVGGEAGGEGETAAPGQLTEAEQAQVDQLEERDREVRDHEQAHARVGGEFAGQPSYEYATGPDDKRYAIAGEVPIDVTPIPGDPEATIAKMEIVVRAALAPAEPSAQDRKVAAEAAALRTQAIAELASARNGGEDGGGDAQQVLNIIA